MADPTRVALRTPLRLGGLLGAIGGFLLAYQNSSGAHGPSSTNQRHSNSVSARFWGWRENEREVKKDFEELSQRAREGKPLYGTSHQPEWVQQAAAANSTFSQLKFCAHFMFSLVAHIADHIYLCLSSCCSNVRTFHVPSSIARSDTLHRFNLVNHNHHGTDPAKYGVQKDASESS